MQGYRVRFEQGRGHQMVLEGEPPVRAEELDDLQYKMLTRGDDIPGVMRIQAEELDGFVSLRYSLTGYRMLAQAFRVERWTMNEALEALAQLAEILEQANEYMLDLDRFSLEDEFIFVGRSWGELVMTYVPITRAPKKREFGTRMEQLIIRWMLNVERPDGPILQKLLRHAGSADFSPVSLRRLLRQLLSNPTGTGDGTARVENQQDIIKNASTLMPSRLHETAPNTSINAPVQRLHRNPIQEPSADAHHDRNSEPLVSTNPRSNPESTAMSRFSLGNRRTVAEPQSLSGLLGEEQAVWDAPTDAEEETDPRRWRIGLMSGAGILTAIAWRFLYLPRPDSRGLFVSIGMTLLAIGACLFLWNGWGRSKGQRKKLSSKDRNNGIDCKENSDSRNPYMASWEDSDDEDSLKKSDQDPNTGSGRFAHSLTAASGINRQRREEPANSLYSNDDVRLISQEREVDPSTTWLRPEEGTMLLAGTNASQERMIDCYLVWERDGGSERIKLTGESLVIGRSKEASQHVDETPGVSRAHLELLCDSERWQAKDLGSRNGSWLNGVPMAPYEAYPLQKGDSLQIASSLYRFRDSSESARA